jgi:His/Glu/Gln/Arg/opine family amino acid ABC transporter permease subunit
MNYEWKWARVPQYLYKVVDGELIWGPLMKGLFVTLDIAWQAGLLALAIGLAAALLRLSRSRVGPALAWFYVELIRNTPILVQILIFYFIIAAILGIPRTVGGILASRSTKGRSPPRSSAAPSSRCAADSARPRKASASRLSTCTATSSCRRRSR